MLVFNGFHSVFYYLNNLVWSQWSILFAMMCSKSSSNIPVTCCYTVERLQEKVCIVQEEAPPQFSKQENSLLPRSIQVQSG